MLNLPPNPTPSLSFKKILVPFFLTLFTYVLSAIAILLTMADTDETRRPILTLFAIAFVLGSVYTYYVVKGVKPYLEAFIRTERRLQQAQALAHVGYWDYELGAQYAIWSRNLCEMHQLTDCIENETGEYLVPQSDSIKNIHPDDFAPLMDAIQRAWTDGTPFNMDHRLLLPDGTVRHLHARCQATRNHDGRIVRLSGIEQDITEQVLTKQAIEQERLRAQQASKLAALGEMAAGIAHEINNPLTVIMSTAYLLKALVKTPNFDAQNVEANLSRIIHTVERISKIIRGFKTLAREGGNDPFTRIRIKSLISETMDICQGRFKNQGIELTWQLPKDEVEIECRPAQVSQVLLNLLNNSFDAVQDGASKWVDLCVREQGDNLEIRISDGGPGVPEEFQQRIMDPFFTTKEVGKGTGLGLSISRSIAKSHHGNLYLDRSAPHTCFVFLLPKCQIQA